MTEKDVLVSRDSLINLEKRARGRSISAFPLFNYQYVAMSNTESDIITIYKVVDA